MVNNKYSFLRFAVNPAQIICSKLKCKYLINGSNEEFFETLKTIQKHDDAIAASYNTMHTFRVGRNCYGQHCITLGTAKKCPLQAQKLGA